MSLTKRAVVVGVNLAICLLLVEGFAALALKIVGGGWTTPGRYAESISQSSLASVDEADLEASYEAPRWILQPYFGYARNPEAKFARVNGRRVNVSVNEHGLFGDSPVPIPSDDRFVVVVTGGSVALELYFDARETLAEEIARLPIAAGRRVEIVCLALGGLKQPQQLLQLNYFLALGAAYDLVVNLDGFNEVVLPLAENLSTGVNPYYPRNWVAYSATSVDLATATLYGRLSELGGEKERRTTHFLKSPLRRTFTGSLLYALRVKRLEATILELEMRLREGLDAESLAPQQRGPAYGKSRRDRVLPDLVALWQRSSEQMAALAGGRGLLYFHFLQPNQYVAGSKPFDAWELEHAINPHTIYARSAIPGYPLLRQAGDELRRAGVPFFDLTDVYAGVGEPIYKDNCCHVNREGSRRIARAIAEQIGAASS